jgi:outer membrane protein assembly factor BamA
MSIDKKRTSMAMADLCIAPDLRNWSATDFSHIDSLIKAGELAAEAAIPALKELLYNKGMGPGNDPPYDIEETQICDLASLPKTFFQEAFLKTAFPTRANIEDNLKTAYSSGYIRDAWAEIDTDSSGARLDYHLVDNIRITSVKFPGATIYSSSDLNKKITSRPGAVLNTVTLAQDKQAVENHYIESGYTLVRVNPEFDSLSGVLTFLIDEGRINQVKIEGNKKTRNWVISRHLHFKNGEVFRQEKGERAIEEIFGTGLFETANMIAVPDTTGITLAVKVKEKLYNFIRGGAHYDLEYNAQAFVDLVAGNVFGGGQEMYISTNLSEKKRSLSLNFRSDRILKTLFTNIASIDYSELKRNRYVAHKYDGYIKQISYGGKLAPGRQFPQLGMISIVGQLHQVNWQEPGNIKRKFTKLSIGFESIVDTRDAICFPQRGKYHYFNIQFAGDIHNEKSGYTRFETSLEAYYQLTKRLNLHPKLAVGASSDFMPYFDEFSFGGLDSFLGLHQDEYLGDKMVLGSLELRQKIGDRFYILTRYNMGNVWNNLERVRLSRLVHGGGIGVGLKTPVGPLETWYGRTNKGLDLFYLDLGYNW